jgi:predicted aspartyl protease/tetratricopeptide (TPR) repeat protein
MIGRPFLLALGLVAALLAAGPVRADCNPRLFAELPVTMRGLRPTVPVKVNGQDAVFFIDTGAFFSVLTPASAARFGVNLRPLPPDITISGAGGGANAYLTTPKTFTLGENADLHIDFLVLEKGFEGNQAGMIAENILGLFDEEFDLANGVVRIYSPKGCDKAVMAYWTQAYSVIPIEDQAPLSHVAMGWASINGVRTHVIFDTGAPRSMLSTEAAARAGVRPDDAGVSSQGYTSGIGLRTYLKAWAGPFESFKIGDEEIKHTKIIFGDLNMGGGDMLLGADFFLSHRVFISNSQHKLYFSYNGGAVFNLEAPAVAEGAAKSTPTPATADDHPNIPTDAAGFALRAAALADRRDYAAAIADLTRAIAMAPADESYVYQRARTELFKGDAQAAATDLDRALAMKPNDPKVLLERAELRIRQGAKDRARVDLDLIDHTATPAADERLRLAEDYQSLALDDDALVQFDHWILAHPKDDSLSMAMNNRCWLRALTGKDLDQALADCNAALKLLPGNPEILDSRGLVRLRRGDFTGAITDYRGSLRMQPDNAWSLYGRGLAELRLGKTSEGEADIKAAEAASPAIIKEAEAHGLTR